MSQAVFGIADSEARAERIVNDLRDAGFTHDSLSILFPDRSGTHEFRHEAHTKSPEGASAGAGTGALLGGALGWLSGVGAIAIPGLGAFIAAGPILAMLSGAAAGATFGGISGALVGYAVPEFEAKQYEDRLRDGNLLISVHTDSVVQQAHAREILSKHGATDISQREEARV
ncbi:MAG: hypothetical protein ABIR79_03875 [Candidatus Binatia bacterium]